MATYTPGASIESLTDGIITDLTNAVRGGKGEPEVKSGHQSFHTANLYTPNGRSAYNAPEALPIVNAIQEGLNQAGMGEGTTVSYSLDRTSNPANGQSPVFEFQLDSKLGGEALAAVLEAARPKALEAAGRSDLARTGVRRAAAD